MKKRARSVLFFVLACAFSVVSVSHAFGQAAATTDDWPTSLHDVQRTAGSNDTNISAAAARTLTPRWTFQTGGPVATTPTVTGGTAYFGSWDGYEYAVNVATGTLEWKTNLGVTNAPSNCSPSGPIGVSSPATVAGGVVYVGGGDGYFYALDAATGAVNWRIWVSGSDTPGNYDGHYNWSAPLIVNGYAYVGVASLGDCPLVQGQLLQISLSGKNIVNTLNIVPNGQVGGGIWTSPAFDSSTNKILLDTGTENSPTQQWAQALLAIDAGSLQVKDSWKLPPSAAVVDSDFGTSTTLFTDSKGDPLIAAINKNGLVYAFNRNNLVAGPVWQQQIAVGGLCPTCGQSSVSSGAFGGGTLFMSGNTGVINGVGYPGTVRALNPSNGSFIWQHGAPGSVIGALAYDNGMVFDGGGSYLEVLDASTGQRLYSYNTGSQIYAGPSVANGVVYVGNTAGRVEAFSIPGSTVQPPPDSNCPTGFTCQDIGSPSPAGSEKVSAGKWTISAGGSGIGGSMDSFRLASEPTNGDAQVSARVTGTPAGSGGQAGVMIRQSNDPGSPYYAVLAKPGNTVAVQYRSVFRGPTTTGAAVPDGGLPLYVMIQRVGDGFQAATSTDGSKFTLIPGSNASIPLPAAGLAGPAVSSGSQGTLGTASMAAVSVGSPSVTLTPPPSPSPCPSGWSCQDIGNPAVVGDQSLSSGTWTVKGAGNGIGQAATTSYSSWPVDDQFHYVWQSLAGDGTISAQITSQTNTSANAQAGLMLRATAGGGAAYYGAWVTPGHGLVVDYRDTNGLLDNKVATVTAQAPLWLEVARSGDVFTTYTSSDGVNWRPVTGSSVALPNLQGTVLAGMAVSSDAAGTLGSATFAHVTSANTAPAPPNLCPPGWVCSDVGFPTPAGNQAYSSGTWTVQGGGADIHDPADSYRFIAQSQETDGVVSAQVASQSNSNPWAKSGVMVRVSTSETSAYYGVFVTPGNGIVVQYRSVEGGSTGQIAVGGAAPTYLKITRSGDTYTASTSNDGVNWQTVAGSTVTIPALTGTLQAGLAVCSHDTLALNTTVFAAVNITGVTGTGGLPSLWSDQDVGGSTPAGSASYAAGTFTVKGGGSDIWGTADQFNYVNQPLNGNASIVARVTSQTPTDPWAKAGIMIKQSPTAGAPYALVAVTPSNGILFQYGFSNTISAGSYTFPNGWLRLDRTGNTFTAYDSPDGANWVKIAQVNISMSATATAGLFVSSHNSSTLGTATFDSVTLTPSGGGPLPSPWASTDVGSPPVAGDSSYNNGEFTLNGSGGDISGTEDQFQYAYQPLSGDGTIVARVSSQTATDPWAKAGIMIKQSTKAGDPYALLAVTPGNGINMEYNFNANVAGGGYSFPNAWLMLSRSGNTFTAYQSTDGSTWTKVGSTTVAMTSSATVGLFVCSHNISTLGTATFDNVSVIPGGGGPLPSPWASADVGNPQLAGESSYANGVFTVNGAGADIWGTDDQFQYAYQPLSGNGTIVARVKSQTATDAWAKAGIMIKQSTTAGDPYALLAVTPSNGVAFQYGFSNSVSGGSYSFPNAWLKLTRANNTFTAYVSADGSTWAQVGSTTVTMATSATAGLFVCSHNTSTLGSATFDNVTVTTGP